MPKQKQFDYLASVEIGNGTGVAIALAPDRCVLELKTPFIVARRQYEPHTLGASMADKETMKPHYTYEGVNYTIGVDTTEYKYGRPTERDTNNTARYGGVLHRFYTAVALHKMGIKSGKIALVVFMPPVPYRDEQKREEVRLNFLNDSPYHLTYTDAHGKQTALAYEYVDCQVMPEGACAIYGMIINPDGTPNKDGVAVVKSGYFAVGDLGSYTADNLLFLNGRVDETSLNDDATIEGMGVHDYIRRPLMKEYGIAQETADSAIIEFVANGCDIDAPVIIMTGDGQHFEVQSDIDQLRRVYFDAIRAKIFNERLQGLRDIKGGVMIGGGAMLIDDLLATDYPSMAYGRGIAEPHMINAESGFRKALADRKIIIGDC